MTDLSILNNWKGDNYDSILVIVDCLIKMVQYKPVKITIDAPELAEVIIDVVIYVTPRSRDLWSRDLSTLSISA